MGSALVICFSKHLKLSIYGFSFEVGGCVILSHDNWSFLSLELSFLCKRVSLLHLLWDLFFLISISLLTLTVTYCKGYWCTSSELILNICFSTITRWNMCRPTKYCRFVLREKIYWSDVITYSVNIPQWQNVQPVFWSCWIGGKMEGLFCVSTWKLTPALFEYLEVRPSRLA